MQKFLPITFAGLACLLLFQINVQAQGCVAVRPMSCSAAGVGNNAGLQGKNQWQVSANYRYFRSYKHFRGDHEETERVELGTEVVNLSNSVDLGVSYGITNRFSVAASLPVIWYDRSSLYEHYGNSLSANPDQLRFYTNAQGIGDLRLSGFFWLMNPENSSRGNLGIGLGIKLPTGDANVQDEFHRKNAEGLDSIVVRAVDQSIQLGDGGVGISLEAQAYRTLMNRGALYFNAFYLSNPRNTNATLTRGTLANVDPLIAYHSVADQYAVRLGMSYAVLAQYGVAASLGMRAEGIPAKDIIGDSEGFRRPGYIVAAEPGLNYMAGPFNINLNVPIALYRNRVKSVYDLADPTGARHGDAAFADYAVNAGLTWRFGGDKTSPKIQPGLWPEATK